MKRQIVEKYINKYVQLLCHEFIELNIQVRKTTDQVKRDFLQMVVKRISALMYGLISMIPHHFA